MASSTSIAAREEGKELFALADIFVNLELEILEAEGEITPAMEEAFLVAEIEEAARIDSLCDMRKKFMGREAMAKEELDRVTAIRRRNRDGAENIRKYLTRYMYDREELVIETDRHQLRIVNNSQGNAELIETEVTDWAELIAGQWLMPPTGFPERPDTRSGIAHDVYDRLLIWVCRTYGRLDKQKVAAAMELPVPVTGEMDVPQLTREFQRYRPWWTWEISTNDLVAFREMRATLPDGINYYRGSHLRIR